MNPVPGPTARERAVHIAGALAELGIARVTITGPDGIRRELRARGTDLPAEILGAPEGTVVGAGPIRVTVCRDGLSWECSDEAVAARLGAALGG